MNFCEDVPPLACQHFYAEWVAIVNEFAIVIGFTIVITVAALSILRRLK